MRILLLAGSYPPETGGIAEFMRAFARGLPANGAEVETIANPPLPGGYFKRVDFCRNLVLERLRSRPFDRVVTSSWSPYAVGLPDIPFDVFCHGMDLLEPSRSWRYRVLMKRTLQRASRILANSAYTAGLAATLGAPTERTVILHPGIDTDRFRPGPERGDAQVILSVGRLVERKGFDMVIRALPEVRKQFPGIQYWCAGDGPDRERLRAMASDLEVQSHIRWLGEITEDAKAGLYQSADVFAMPNRIVESEGSVEGFGIVFLEAAACALPVIAGDSGGSPDAVVHNQTGFIVSPMSQSEITGRLIELLGDGALRHRLGNAGRARARSDFREEQIAERYLRAI